MSILQTEIEELTVFVEGALDDNSIKNIISGLDDKISGCERLIFDFSTIRHADSSAVAMLIVLHKLLPETFPLILLRNLPPNGKNLIQMMCLEHLFEFDG